MPTWGLIRIARICLIQQNESAAIDRDSGRDNMYCNAREPIHFMLGLKCGAFNLLPICPPHQATAPSKKWKLFWGFLAKVSYLVSSLFLSLLFIQALSRPCMYNPVPTWWIVRWRVQIWKSSVWVRSRSQTRLAVARSFTLSHDNVSYLIWAAPQNERMRPLTVKNRQPLGLMHCFPAELFALHCKNAGSVIENLKGALLPLKMTHFSSKPWTRVTR